MEVAYDNKTVKSYFPIPHSNKVQSSVTSRRFSGNDLHTSGEVKDEMWCVRQ